MMKKIGFSTAALFAMLICIQPATMFAEGRDEARQNNNRYTEQRTARDQNDYRGRAEQPMRDREARDTYSRDDRDQDRNRTHYRDNNDWDRYNSLRR